MNYTTYKWIVIHLFTLNTKVDSACMYLIIYFVNYPSHNSVVSKVLIDWERCLIDQWLVLAIWPLAAKISYTRQEAAATFLSLLAANSLYDWPSHMCSYILVSSVFSYNMSTTKYVLWYYLIAFFY